MDSDDWQKKYGWLGKELLSWSIENFWDPEIQNDAGLPGWLWLLDTLMLDDVVLAELADLGSVRAGCAGPGIRDGRPRLYLSTPPEVLEQVRLAATRLAVGP